MVQIHLTNFTMDDTIHFFLFKKRFFFVSIFLKLILILFCFYI